MDDQRDYQEEAYWREFCPECGGSPCIDREPPWLGDVDRRADDDIEFCVEGE